MAKPGVSSIELEPIDRLEEKVKRLIGVVERMKSEQARVAEENQRLLRDLESMRARIAATDSVATELSALPDPDLAGAGVRGAAGRLRGREDARSGRNSHDGRFVAPRRALGAQHSR